MKRRKNPGNDTLILVLVAGAVLYYVLYNQANNPVGAYVNSTLPLTSPVQASGANTLNASIAANAGVTSTPAQSASLSFPQTYPSAGPAPSDVATITAFPSLSGIRAVGSRFSFGRRA